MKTNYPDSLTIQQYLTGTLDPKLMHALEMQALEDPFLFEALEGYSKVSNPGQELSILQRQLHERIKHLQENKKEYNFTWQRLSVAAAAAVMFISAGILFWMNSQKQVSTIASNSKQVEVSITSLDTINAQLQIDSAKPSEERLAGVKSKPEADRQIAQKKRISSKEGDKLNDALNTDSKSLSEVVVSGSGSPKKSNDLQPVFGWDSYHAYLKENIRQPKNEPNAEGKVLVAFSVEPNGMLTNFRIIQGLSKACNIEAIRLIKEGPAWKPAADGKTKEAKVEIDFKAK